MRIAIDARLNAYRQGGISQYTRQLMTALAEVAHDDTLISLQHHSHLRPLVVAPNVVRRTIVTPPHHRLEQWTLPLETMLAKPDVLHCPDFVAPRRRPFPAVVTIHDLAFLHYPQILDDAARTFYGQVKASALRANAIIAVSEATRQDIAQLLDIPIEQIDVIYEAAAPVYSRLELRPGEVRVLDGTPVTAGSFLLFVSTLEPRKNLPTLLRALRICLDRTPSAAYRLVVAGSRGWHDDEIFSTVRDLRLEEHVVFARRVGQYDLRWLYNACRLYVNPSLYEGFGLPLLEAMACGAPCLAAATSSLPEIGGEAAIYVPPLDAGTWADLIAELWDDEERRAELGRRGRVQAQRFSWVRAARETLAVYRRVVEARDLPRAVTPQQALLPPEQPMSPEVFCPHCGAAWAEGRLTGAASVQLADRSDPPLPLDPRAQVCPACGRVQLQAQAAQQAEPLPELRMPPPPEASEAPNATLPPPLHPAVHTDIVPTTLPTLAAPLANGAEDTAEAPALPVSASPAGEATQPPANGAPEPSSATASPPDARHPLTDGVGLPTSAGEEAPEGQPPASAAAPAHDTPQPALTTIPAGATPTEGDHPQAHMATPDAQATASTLADDATPPGEEPVAEPAAAAESRQRSGRSSRRKRSRQS